MSDELIAIEFDVPGHDYPPEAINHSSPPQKGEEVEVGARFDGTDRLDANIADFGEWDNADYRVILRGEVSKVSRHYCRARSRNELTVYVKVEFAEENHGYIPTGLD